ncbi:hypothetical protein [Streptodolium elevatio]
MSSCKDCLAWGDHFYTDVCQACHGWAHVYAVDTCRCCQRQMACKAGYCRPCRVQASFNHPSGDKTRIDLSTPTKTGYQLRFADMVRAARLPAKPAPVLTAAPGPRLVRPRPNVEQLTCCTVPRDIRGVRFRGLTLPHPEFTAFVLARAEEFAQIRGWSKVVLRLTKRGLTILTATHEPFEPILATTVEQLTDRKLPAKRVKEVLADLELLHDDRQDVLTKWVGRQLARLPPAIQDEVGQWVALMRDGSTRARPRARQTVLNHVRLAALFLAWVVAERGYTTLREVTHEDCQLWLDGRARDRAWAIGALRSLFTALKARRVIFTNPMRQILFGRNHRSIPAPLAPHRLATAAASAADDPLLRIVLALAAIHAVTAVEIRSVRMEDVDLTSNRITLRGASRPLDAYTRQALVDYLRLRHAKWPRTANPHLLVNLTTANETGPATHTWLTVRLRDLGLTISELRTDRILDEAQATRGDPLHLATLFNMTTSAAVRYTGVVHGRDATS